MIPKIASKTLVINADGVPLVVVSWKRGMSLVMNGLATQLDFHKNAAARDGKGNSYPIPAVVVLKKYVRRDYRSVPFGRKNVLIRDALTCQYCNRVSEPSELTLDHVIPKSKWKGKGTPTFWENIVTCCMPCNRRKADRTCDEAGMRPIVRPVKPAYSEKYIGISPWRDKIPQEWTPYLTKLSQLKGVPNESRQS